MKVNMDDLLLAGLLDNDDELILLSQVCSGSDVPSFEKGFDLDTYTEEQSKASFRFYKDDIRNLCVDLGIPREFRARNGTATLHRTSFLLVPTSMETYKENLQVANLFHSQPN